MRLLTLRGPGGTGKTGLQATVSREKALAGASRLALYQEDRQAAERLARERLAVNRELSDDHAIASALADLSVTVAGGAEARHLLHESRAISRRLGATSEEARAVGNLGAVAWEEGDFEQASRLFAEAIPLHEAVGNVRGVAVASNGVGRAAACLGREAEARPHLERALRLSRELSDQHEASLALEGFALVALQGDDPERAAVLLAHANALRHSVSTATTLHEQEIFEDAVDAARECLGEKAFELVWRRGAALEFDEAAAYALGAVDPQSTWGGS